MGFILCIKKDLRLNRNENSCLTLYIYIYNTILTATIELLIVVKYWV